MVKKSYKINQNQYVINSDNMIHIRNTNESIIQKFGLAYHLNLNCYIQRNMKDN